MLSSVLSDQNVALQMQFLPFVSHIILCRLYVLLQFVNVYHIDIKLV